MNSSQELADLLIGQILAIMEAAGIHTDTSDDRKIRKLVEKIMKENGHELS